MPKPTGATVIIWRDLAQEGYTYAEIARKFPEYSVNQIRHYCLKEAVSLDDPGVSGGVGTQLMIDMDQDDRAQAAGASQPQAGVRQGRRVGP